MEERTGEEKQHMMERERGSNAHGLLSSPERDRRYLHSVALSFFISFLSLLHLRAVLPPTNLLHMLQNAAAHLLEKMWDTLMCREGLNAP